MRPHVDPTGTLANLSHMPAFWIQFLLHSEGGITVSKGKARGSYQKKEKSAELAKTSHIHTAFISVLHMLPPVYGVFNDS